MANSKLTAILAAGLALVAVGSSQAGERGRHNGAGAVIGSGNSFATGGTIIGSGNSGASARASGGSVIGSGDAHVIDSGNSGSGSSSEIKGSGNSNVGIGVTTGVTVKAPEQSPPPPKGMNGWKNGALDTKGPKVA